MIKGYILTIIFLFQLLLQAQNSNGKISGRITDFDTKEPVSGAVVKVLEKKIGTVSDINGEYSISNLSPETYSIQISYVGHETKIISDVVVNNTRPTRVDIELKQSILQLKDITIRSSYFDKDPSMVISTRNFNYEEIRRTPGGFEDVVRSLSILPGVAQAEAGRNDLVVRGGAPSENLYILDNIEIPNINHFGTQGASGGALSFINLDFVRETSFSTGGYPVIYGDRLSSVLNISMRNGRDDRVGGKATISASQFGLNLEGPIGKGNNFLFSIRRSYLDLIFKAAGFGFVPEYYDAVTKLNFDLSTTSSLTWIFTGAFDNVRYFNDTEDQRYKNSTILGSNQIIYATGLTYKNVMTNGYYSITLSRNHTDFDTQQRDSLLLPVFKNISLEGENAIRADLLMRIFQNNELSIGVSGKTIRFRNDVLFPSFITTFGDSLPVNYAAGTNNYLKGAVYLNLNSKLFDHLITNAGIRVDYFNPLNKKTYIAPRFSASYQFNELTSLNFSSGIYYQSPSYIWLFFPGNKENLKSIRADHYVLGIDYILREDAILKIEGFVKSYSDYPASLLRKYLILSNTGGGYSGSQDNFSSFGLEPLISRGEGISRGVELSLQKKLSDIRCYGLLSITYSKTDFKSLDQVTRGGVYDQNFILNLSGGYKFNEFWEASLKFRYASPMLYTPYEINGTQLVSKYLSKRLEPLHSLDLRVDKRWGFGKYTMITYIDVQNVYNNKTSSSVIWDRRTQKEENQSSIGILPSIGISLEF